MVNQLSNENCGATTSSFDTTIVETHYGVNMKCNEVGNSQKENFNRSRNRDAPIYPLGFILNTGVLI